MMIYDDINLYVSLRYENNVAILIIIIFIRQAEEIINMYRS